MSKRLSRRRIRLWQCDPRCHWCKVPTLLVSVLKGEKYDEFPTMATIDHLTTRLQGRIPNLERENTVLSCYKCNKERNEKEMAETPKEILRQRSIMGKLKKLKNKAAIFIKPESEKPKLPYPMPEIITITEEEYRERELMKAENWYDFMHQCL